ncbi:VWA domain-containing protein [Candidatus Saccharibacteria bacterium]|nr:VWA domain-containing protein [Candidatus Saccharibacteria bacterium]
MTPHKAQPDSLPELKEISLNTPEADSSTRSDLLQIAHQSDEDNESAPSPDTMHPHSEALTPEFVARMSERIYRESDVLCRILGIYGVSFRLGAGFSTNMETGAITLDAKDYLDPTVPDEWNEQGVLHELAAHLRTIITEPAAARSEREFSKKGTAYHFFQNIVTDIRGNNLIMERLPRYRQITSELYEQHLFQQGDMTARSRHVQLMSAIIAQEMSPGREIIVSPEVQTAIDTLRDWEGSGFDVIKHITRASKSLTEEMTAFETMELAKHFILPIYERLLEQDKAEKEQQQASGGDSGEGTGFESEYGEILDAQHKGHSHDQDIPDEAKKKDAPDKIADMAEKIKATAKSRKPKSPEEKLKESIEKETGRSIYEYQAYMARFERYRREIEDMMDFFKQIVTERSSRVRRLSKPRTEGAILDPTTLAQTYTDIRAGVMQPPAYQDYEYKNREREVSGKFDIYVALDASGSMLESGFSQVAADAALIIMEGLDGYMQAIREEEQTEGIDLDLDARTAMYLFGSEAECVKSLSTQLDRKERLDLYHGAMKDHGSTGDYLALQQILQQVRASNDEKRHRIIFFIADGGSDSPSELLSVVTALKAEGCIMIPIGLSGKAESLRDIFGSDTKMIEEIEQLPEYLVTTLEEEIRSRT